MTNKELDEYLNKQAEEIAKKITDQMCDSYLKDFVGFLFTGTPKQKTITVNGVSYPFDGKTDVSLQTRKGDIIGRIK